MNKLEKELSFLFLATAYTNMYKNIAKKQHKVVDELLQDLGKKSRLFLPQAKKSDR